mgnify:CR=1 FL=1
MVLSWIMLASRGRAFRALTLGEDAAASLGVNIARIKAHSASALRHWHESEDEFIYMLEGELVRYFPAPLQEKFPAALLEVAAKLDQELRGKGSLRPLHCIPMVIKDQMETKDLRTTDGSLTAFANDRPPNDGTLVAKLRAA